MQRLFCSREGRKQCVCRLQVCCVSVVVVTAVRCSCQYTLRVSITLTMENGLAAEVIKFRYLVVTCRDTCRLFSCTVSQ